MPVSRRYVIANDSKDYIKTVRGSELLPVVYPDVQSNLDRLRAAVSKRN